MAYFGSRCLTLTHSHTHTHTHTGRHTQADTHISLQTPPSLFSQYQMASAESICQTSGWRTLALRPADHSFIWTHTRPLVPDLLSPLLSLSVRWSLLLLLLLLLLLPPHLPFLVVRLVLSCCSRHHPSCSVITRLRLSTHLQLLCCCNDGGMEGLTPGWGSEFTWSPLHLTHAFTHSLFNKCWAVCFSGTKKNLSSTCAAFSFQSQYSVSVCSSPCLWTFFFVVFFGKTSDKSRKMLPFLRGGQPNVRESHQSSQRLSEPTYREQIVWTLLCFSPLA